MSFLYLLKTGTEIEFGLAGEFRSGDGKDWEENDRSGDGKDWEENDRSGDGKDWEENDRCGIYCRSRLDSGCCGESETGITYPIP